MKSIELAKEIFAHLKYEKIFYKHFPKIYGLRKERMKKWRKLRRWYYMEYFRRLQQEIR